MNTDELYFDGYHPFPKSFMGMEGILNTGNGSVIWGSGEPVAKVAFDEIVDLMTGGGEDEVRLLKLDCEGAEWPILQHLAQTSPHPRNLRRVSRDRRPVS